MAKGSQLSQLKNALSQAGLSKQQQQQKNGKKRKRSVLDEKEKQRKAAKLKEIQQKMNPFDVKVTKLKHDVGGRRIAGTVGRPAQSKQAGIERRKKTLLKEFEDRDHAGGILDRRFGENDPTMTPEERMLERFTRERQRNSRGDAYNLEDDDELTHYGQSLSNLDDFDNVGLRLEEEEEDQGHIDRRTVHESHFGGFDDEDDDDEDSDGQPQRKKSKAEVMSEVMAKSKEYKAPQQEEDVNLRHQLDEELDTLRSLLYAPDPSLKASDRHSLEEKPSSAPAAFALPTDEKDQEYDQFVRELAFEKRAQPKDRTKTEEELAVEEKEALEKAEKQRLRRMQGLEDIDDDEDRGGKGRRRQRGGDDLDDDFVDEENTSGVLGAGLEGQEVEEDSEDSEDDDEGGGEEGDLTSEDSEEEGDNEAEESESETLVKTNKYVTNSSGKTVDRKELPYTFPCPGTHDEFLEIIEDVEDADLSTVVKRIRTLYHPSLAQDNKFKLQALTGVLIDHILYITSPPTPKFTLLASLIPHLYALSKSFPTQSAKRFVEKLNLMQKNLKRGLSHGVTESSSKTWPGLAELSLLRVTGLIWPTSDMNHPVISPARLLMGSYLGLCRVRSLQDIASGLFLCTLFLQYEGFSKRLVPEAITFLYNAILHLAPNTLKDESALPGCFPAPDFRSDRCMVLAIISGKATKRMCIRKPDLTRLLAEGTMDEQAKVDLLGLTLELMNQYADLYKGFQGFVELFEPATALMDSVKCDGLPHDVTTKLSSTKDMLGRLLKFSHLARRPLVLQAHKAIPIATYIPRFEHSSSNYLRNRDPDHERNESAKLRAQYKQEKKGAIRELRKDARFLAAEQQKKEKEKDQVYNERMKKVYGSLESERAEQKAMDKEKMKDKKRSGRK
ncbi:Nop14-like protein [Cytidiella melzeri]|nr:Nop14-like protein [Cytidiella melzeri]